MSPSVMPPEKVCRLLTMTCATTTSRSSDGRPDLLHRLRDAGLVPTLTPVGGLRVGPRCVLSDGHRAAIEAVRDELVKALQFGGAGVTPPVPPLPRRSCDPLMTHEQGDDCDLGGWDDEEIDADMAQETRFARMGRAAADHFAKRLTMRDCQHDDRRLRLECAALVDNRRCLVAARGRLPRTACWLALVMTILQRCEGFTPAQGLN